MLRCLKTDAVSFCNIVLFKKSDDACSPQKKPVPVNVSDAGYLFCLHMTISDAGVGLVLHGSVQFSSVQFQFSSVLHM